MNNTELGGGGRGLCSHVHLLRVHTDLMDRGSRGD